MKKVYNINNQSKAKIIFKKINKSAISTIIESIIQNRTNEEFIKYNKRKESKKKY